MRDEHRGVLLLHGGVQSNADDVAQTTRIEQEQSDSSHEIRQFMRMTKQREAIASGNGRRSSRRGDHGTYDMKIRVASLHVLTRVERSFNG